MSFWGPPYFKGCLYPVLSAVLAGALGWAVGYVYGLLAGSERPDMNGWALAVVAAVLVWTVDHFLWMGVIDRAWGVRMEEERTKQAREAAQAQPAAPETQLRFLTVSEDRMEGDFVHLPANDRQLMEFATGVLRGMPVTYRIWCRNGGPFSEGQWAGFSAALVQRGLAERTASGQVTMTVSGLALLRAVVEREGDLSPTGETVAWGGVAGDGAEP